MAIEDEGFLAPEADAWRITHTHAFREEFRCARDLNRTALRMMRGSEEPLLKSSTLAQRIGRLLFIRLISNFEGALLLAERGMIVETRALTRVALETTLYLAAVANEPEMAELISEFSANKAVRPLQGLLKQPDWAARFRSDPLATIKQAVEMFGGFRDIRLAEVAATSGLNDLYEQHYRSLSEDAVHPRIAGLERYLEATGPDDVCGFAWGPAYGSAQLGDTINLLVRVMILGCVALNDLLGEALEERSISAHWAVLRGLTPSL